MALSQFIDAVLVEGNLTVEGTTAPDTMLAANPELVVIHYAIMQGGVMVRGTLDRYQALWTDTQPAEGVQEGPALATGVVVVFRDAGLMDGAFETFNWSQEIRVRNP
jgi:hypothetical protein